MALFVLPQQLQSLRNISAVLRRYQCKHIAQSGSGSNCWHGDKQIVKPQSSKINPGAKPQNLVSPHRPSFLCDCGDTICPSSCCFYCKRPFPQNKQCWCTPCMIASSGCLCTISFPQNKQTLLNVFSLLLLLQKIFSSKQTNRDGAPWVLRTSMLNGSVHPAFYVVLNHEDCTYLWFQNFRENMTKA